MASSFAVLLSKQEELMKVIDQAMPKFKKMAHARRTAVIIQRRLTDLNAVITQVRENHAELKVIASADQLNHRYFKEDLFGKCAIIYDEAIELYEESLVSDIANSTSHSNLESSVVHTAPVATMPLPKLKLPVFNGDISEWEEFRDRFTAMIIKDHRLSDSDRMKYLCTSVSGPARRAIAHLRITDSNFTIAWESVCNRFQNVRENISARFDTFHSVQNVSANSLRSLQTLQEVMNSTSRSIQGLGRKVDGWGDLYVDSILRKLDKETRVLLADRLTTDKEPITLEQIEEFVEHRIRVLQSTSKTSSTALQSQRSENSTRKRTNEQSKLLLNTTVKSIKCILCSGPHRLFRCEQFLKLLVPDRRTVVKNNRCCWLCLSKGHSVRECRSTYKCTECTHRHNILLHQSDAASRNTIIQSTATSSPASSKSNTVLSSNKLVSHAHVEPDRSKFSVLLATAWVKIFGLDGRHTTVRALLDQGSEVTLLSDRIASLLHLPRINRATKICGVGGLSCISQSTAQIGIGNKLSIRAEQFTEALIVSSLTQVNPARASGAASWTHLSGITLADPNFTGSNPIDVIIGAELYGCFLRKGVRHGRKGTPIAHSSLGWILSGSYLSDFPKNKVSVHASVLEQLNYTLQQFWQLEELPSDPCLSPAERECEEHFKNTHARTSTGRYIVRLPFRSEFNREFGNSRLTAVNCWRSIEKRLASDNDKSLAYRTFMKEYEDLGHMSLSPVTPNDHAPCSHYFIPHHAVFRTINNLSKIRVVFNASRATTNGLSLNDQLLIGPPLQQDLSLIILRWRWHRFVITADIAKMYRQILVDPEDTPFQRIVWRDAPHMPIQEFELKTVTYGTSAAPFLALRVIQQLASDEGQTFPLAQTVLRNSTYVDDCLFGASTINDTLEIRSQLVHLLNRGHFTLAKWSANLPELLSGLDMGDQQITDKEFAPSDSIKVLGIK